MKKYFICFSLFVIQIAGYTQTDSSINKEEEDFVILFVPTTSVISQCYKSPRLDSIFMQLPKQKGDGRQPKLSEAQFDSLNDTELLIYAHKYPESFSQICSLFPTDKDLNKKLQAYLPLVIFGVMASKRQTEALLKRRATEISLIEKCLMSNSRSDAELNRTIVSLKAFELIPVIINIINEKDNTLESDTYLFTDLMMLMKNDHYQPFTSSKTYEDLYESNKAYWKANIVKTKENIDFVIKMASEYYSFKTNKS